MRSWFIAKDIGDGPQSLEPERALWASVVHQAIDDLNGHGVVTGDYGEMKRFRAEQRRQALDWILSPSIEVSSFRWACAQLEIDPGAAQQRILRGDQDRAAGEKKPGQKPLMAKMPQAVPSTARESVALAAKEEKPAPLKIVSGIQPPLQTSAKPVSIVREIKPKARKDAMANNGNGNGRYNLEALREAARHFGEELAAAEKIVARLKPVVVHLNGAVAALETQRPAPPLKIAVKTNGHANGAGKPARQVFQPVPKRPPYEKAALVDALRAELQKSAEPMHHDELTRAIFAGGPEQLWRAKQCVTATLTHCVKKGYWTRLPDGRYALGACEGIESGLAAAR